MIIVYLTLAAALLADVLALFPTALHRLVVYRDLRPQWLAHVPLLNTTFVPRLADASPFAWVLLFTPLSIVFVPRLVDASPFIWFLLLTLVVPAYVWWDWWDEIGDLHGRARPGVWALGFFVPFLGSVLLFRLRASLPRMPPGAPRSR